MLCYSLAPHKKEASNPVRLSEADLELMAQVPALLLCGLGQIVYSMNFLSNCDDDNSTWGSQRVIRTEWHSA